MSKLTLPVRPNLEQLKKQAKELLIQLRRDDPQAAALFATHHPRRRHEGRVFALHDAQLVLARQHGFANWTQLKDEVRRLTSDFSERASRFVFDAADGDFRAGRAWPSEPELAQPIGGPRLPPGKLRSSSVRLASMPRGLMARRSVSRLDTASYSAFSFPDGKESKDVLRVVRGSCWTRERMPMPLGCILIGKILL
jgi:hypothetical protein